MNQKIVIGIVLAVALAGALYLWYANRTPALPPQLADGQLGQEPAPPTEEAIEDGIEGTWRSLDDAAFTRTFNANGTVTDRYEGDASATGRYELDGGNIPAQVRDIADGKPVLSIEFPEERLFFLVSRLDADLLELVYVGGNGMLRFERI